MPAVAPSSFPRSGVSSLSLALVVAVHGATLWALTTWSSAGFERPPQAKVLSVRFLSTQPEPVKPPETAPAAPPPPKPVLRPKPRTLIAAAARPEPAPEASEVPPPPATQEPAEEAEPIGAYAPASAAPAEAEPEPPRFDMAYLNNPAPAYPAMSRKLGEEGTVRLRVLVSAQGEAVTVELDQSSGFGRLDDAALRAVRRWRFVPAKRGTQAVEGWALVPIVFSRRKS